MDQIVAYVKPLKEFAKDSMRLVKRCTKPDLKGTNKIVLMRSLLCALIIFQSFRRLLWPLPLVSLSWGSLDSS